MGHGALRRAPRGPRGHPVRRRDRGARGLRRRQRGVTRRQEDHVGYKVEYENDVPLTTADGALGVTCDYLVRVHQGSHSPDALSNNVHELLYASRCSDGTEIISNIVSRFGAPGAYTRGCDTAVTVTTSAAPTRPVRVAA